SPSPVMVTWLRLNWIAVIVGYTTNNASKKTVGRGSRYWMLRSHHGARADPGAVPAASSAVRAHPLSTFVRLALRCGRGNHELRCSLAPAPAPAPPARQLLVTGSVR